jgi:hypothetical protein
MRDVVAVRQRALVAFAARSSYRAAQGLDATASTASWKTTTQPASNENLFEANVLYDYANSSPRNALARMAWESISVRATATASRPSMLSATVKRLEATDELGLPGHDCRRRRA